MKKLKNPVVALGIFDGVHIGHRKVLNMAIKRANAIGGTSIVLTFSPHPLKVLAPQKAPPLLTSVEHRIRLIKSLGVDLCCIARFDKKFSSLTPSQFVKKILVDKLGTKEVVVGYDYAFGRKKKGDAASLEKLGRVYGFKVRRVKPVKVHGRIVSSSLIRTLIESGGLQTASSLLGRPVSILGTVVKGDSRARTLGYPTANIKPHHEVVPPSGIYAVMIDIGGIKKHGILYIGTRPTFKKTYPSPFPLPQGERIKMRVIKKEIPIQSSYEPKSVIEAHIFDYHKRVYGKEIEVTFVKRLRAEKRFRNQNELIEQIKKDEREAKTYFRNGIYFSLYKH